MKPPSLPAAVTHAAASHLTAMEAVRRTSGCRRRAFIWLPPAVAVFACMAAKDASASPYVSWTAAMTSSQSSDLGGYPAQNVFESLGRGDWSYQSVSAQGAAGFSLRDDFHGNWHSLADPNLKQSPSGTMAREWLAADFGEVLPITGADVWNTNWDVISNTRAVKGMSIDVSADNVNWTTVWSGDLKKAPGIRPHLMFDGVNYVNPTLEPGHAPQFGLLATDSLSFAGAVEARYVVLNIQTNHGGDAYFALDEIKFIALPIPEPATASLAALTALGLACRSARRSRGGWDNSGKCASL